MAYTVGDAYHITTTFEMYISPLEAQNGFFNEKKDFKNAGRGRSAGCVAGGDR